MGFLFNFIVLRPITPSPILKIPVLRNVNINIYLFYPIVHTKQSKNNKSSNANKNVVIGYTQL